MQCKKCILFSNLREAYLVKMCRIKTRSAVNCFKLKVVPPLQQPEMKNSFNISLSKNSDQQFLRRLW